ncbi:PREDICTED: ankyrin repeat domain-containing protein 13B-like [Trachymyrmex cornetzi]|uniref:ankyrin repeat domain-containing protein 13B-like n=1 Tax=Trachymyrmex cornetzi TaxID=471704 RepID=UPI00084F1F3F|nr:PREDICTED: ankyrin repeat domain-containing protein 13B-like [Trachymyrmex cornetzi]
MVNIDTIRKNYPLHWLVWHNSYVELDKELSTNQHDIEKHDNRGRTPLMLAVTLGHTDSAVVLLQHEANVNTENTQGWTVVQEAVGTGNPELLQLVLARRDYQRYCNRVAGIPELLHKLKQAPDFYVEMKWEFTSWVPLVSRMCPSDTYKVYKQGSNVRIDTTLLGFDHANWQRGNRSYVFKGQNDGATMMEVDHETRKVYVEHMKLIGGDNIQLLEPSEEGVIARLTNPIVTTYIDTDKISFERNKAGLWGWRSDKSEVINGHECKVFSASNVELITKTRLEHLSEADKARARAPRTPLQSFLGIAEQQQESCSTVATSK